MNKKVSTLLTMGLFLGGSLFNVVSAENLYAFIKGGQAPSAIEKLESGKQYFLGINGQFLHSSVDSKKITYEFVENSKDIEKEDLKEYLWTVTAVQQGSGNMAYTFANAKSGKQIFFVHDGTEWKVSSNADEKFADNTQNLFYWGGNDAPQNFNEEGAKFKASTLAALEKSNKGVAYFGNNNKVFDAVDVPEEESALTPVMQPVSLYDIADGINVDVENLNKLYNSTGFNFNLDGDKLAGVGNIFGDKKIVALKVKNICNPDNSAEKFPDGTYFATYAPVNKNEAPTFAELLNCTFIAVNPVTNIADDADLQKAGVGFTLTEVKGRDLVIEFDNDDNNVSTGNQISVYNACFNVKESTTADLYSLSLLKVRYVKESGKTEHGEAALGISASKGSSEIATVSAPTNYIFKFAESTVVKPISLLKKEGAAIYNIKFYQKNGADTSVNGKYLTWDVDQKEFIAKGSVLADLNTPAYQWVISKVLENNNVEFTNRETGETLVTQLFVEGENLYSLAPADKSTTFSYYNIDEKGNVYEYKNENGVTNLGLKGKYVQLLPVEEVDNYAGYLNVEDETVMTLSFGRDIAPTSNKLYPVVESDKYGYYFNGELTGNVEAGAQWLLHKSVNPEPMKFNYVYANGELINTKTQGDVVYAYTYTLELAVDGKAQEQYLKAYMGINPGVGSNIDLTDKTNATEFFIQENKDGSVSLKQKRNDNTALLLADYKETGWSINEFKYSRVLFERFGASSEADYVKTYLIAEAPAVSLPGNEGHYSIATELGNYITMNEERDGLTVKEETDPLYLYVTDQKAVVPSFYVTKAAENKAERMFLFNPTDSVDYYVAEGQYSKKYQLDEIDAAGNHPTKVIFKAASINETRDTLKTNIKGEMATVAMKANNTNKVVGGLDKFKVQIIESADADGLYVIRQAGEYVTVVNGKMAWGSKGAAQKFEITGAEAPTSNESVAASEVKVIANNGSINVKNAAGKNVVVSTILGQVVANEVLTSDNATINVPAGIVVVAVEGESFKVNVK